MQNQMIFKRYELKYLLTAEQKGRFLEQLKPYLKPDEYGKTVIRNLYYDTENYRLIRRSLEQPAYKEKLRIRSYRRAEGDEPVFVELKKKAEAVVYKRRMALPLQQATQWLAGKEPPPVQTQIAEEIRYFRDYYATLRPTVFLSYAREAYYLRDDDGFRVTFDENILSRRRALTLSSEPWGTPLLPPGQTLMEIKTAGAIPLWLTQLLTQEHIFKTSFSKYGVAYMTMIYPFSNAAQPTEGRDYQYA